MPRQGNATQRTRLFYIFLYFSPLISLRDARWLPTSASLPPQTQSNDNHQEWRKHDDILGGAWASFSVRGPELFLKYPELFLNYPELFRAISKISRVTSKIGRVFPKISKLLLKYPRLLRKYPKLVLKHWNIVQNYSKPPPENIQLFPN